MKQLRDVSHLDMITRVRIETRLGPQYFHFDPQQYCMETERIGGRIQAFSQLNINRFEMSDGSFYHDAVQKERTRFFDNLSLFFV